MKAYGAKHDMEDNTQGRRCRSVRNGQSWVILLCLVALCYVLLVCFSMYKISDSTTQLYEYPYTVSREAQKMKARLYGMRDTLPALLATPGVSRAQIEDMLKQQESAQDASLEKIRLRFRGATSELSNLEQGMLDIRKARRQMIEEMLGITDFNKIYSCYARSVLPFFDKLEGALDSLSRQADLRGAAILVKMDQIRFFFHYSRPVRRCCPYLVCFSHQQAGEE